MNEPARVMPRFANLTRRHWPTLWCVLALAVFVSFLGRNTQLATHELRVTETAAAMSRSGWPWNATPVDVPQVELRQGADGSHLQQRADGATWSVNPWLVPVFEGQIRLQKPPLPYWTTAIVFRLFGEGPGVARVVPALMGAISCALIALLARHVAGRRTAFVAFAIAVSTFFAIDEFRKIMADPFLACLSLAAIVAWVSASSRVTGRQIRVIAFYALLGLASLAKGPVTFLHVGVALNVFTFAVRRRPRVAIAWHLLGAAIYLAIALPWPIYIVRHLPNAMEVWRFESVGEFVDNQRNARPLFYYGPSLLLIAAPWTVMWLVGGVDAWQRRARPGARRRLFAWAWLIAIVLVFSCSHMKKNAYLLPVVPAIVLIVAQTIVRSMAIARRRPNDAGVRWIAAGHWIGGVAFSVAIAIASFKYLGHTLATVVALAGVLLALLPLRSAMRRDFERWFTLQAIAFALLILLLLAFPEAEHRSRKRPSADEARALPAAMELAVR